MHTKHNEILPGYDYRLKDIVGLRTSQGFAPV
ncbi:hypothetical protein CJA_0290 [Cellvibrio japonicus Ueda107]|uniref:Uncharacterized protein n=1 Tax=Cellvibrio japonicus (strain Ueda107) TaxID=498211 RepID=B3PH93_CELJU|nr:hypothetical protein CJA_0290 [Cellvibrio japonicus Ueda107]